MLVLRWSDLLDAAPLEVHRYKRLLGRRKQLYELTSSSDALQVHLGCLFRELLHL